MTRVETMAEVKFYFGHGLAQVYTDLRIIFSYFSNTRTNISVKSVLIRVPKGVKMAAQQKSADKIVNRMIQLAEKGYNCSQILMILSLEQEDKEIPDLVRAMSGLGDGCGFFKETCGVMTGAVCLLSWYAGKGSDSEEESEKLLPMLQDFGDWFQQEIGEKYNGTRCKDIAGDLVGTPEVKQICGSIIFQAFNKVNEILAEYNYT